MSTSERVVLDKLAYSIPNFAKAVDMSVEAVRQQIRDGKLVVGYPNSKPIISRTEGERWLKALPSERA